MTLLEELLAMLLKNAHSVNVLMSVVGPRPGRCSPRGSTNEAAAAVSNKCKMMSGTDLQAV